MLTTTLDGLWALQVLTGIEVLAPELGLRPHLPSVETGPRVLHHPVAEDLCAAGVIDAAGTVDDTVREWLTVLSRRDVAVLLFVQRPNEQEPERILLARFAQWWVRLERYGSRIRLSGAGTATSEQSAGRLITAQIEEICGHMQPASIRPATIDAAEILSAVADPASLRRFLVGHRLDSDQINTLILAADREQSAQAGAVAIQAGAGDGPARAHIEPGVVTIIDTPQGRLVSEHVSRGGKSWLVVGPGSSSTISSAVRNMLRNLPAQDQWYSHRKVV